MIKLINKQFFGPAHCDVFVFFIDHCDSYSYAKVTASQLDEVSRFAACLFKLPAGASAEVEVYDDREAGHVFSVEIDNSQKIASKKSICDRGDGEAMVDIQGECVKVCEGVSMSAPCNIFSETAHCECNDGDCHIECHVSQ